MSPNDAPLSDEPYCATASFSSAISSALIDRPTRRSRLSRLVTMASSLSPIWKRSGRWSWRSRDRSERRIKAVTSPSATDTSRPPSVTAVTSHVTVSPRRKSATLSNGSPSSCLMPRLTRSLSWSTSSTTASTVCPLSYCAKASSPEAFQSRSEICTMPSMSLSRPTNKPNSVMFLISPDNFVPTGNFDEKSSHGFSMHCFRPNEMRRFSASTSRTMTSTSWLVDTILPG